MNCQVRADKKSGKVYFVLYMILGLIALLLVDALVLSWRL